MRDNTNNQPNVSDPPRRAGSLAEPPRGTVVDVSHDAIAHDRHDEGAARRQELDLPPPLDASGKLAERVRATFTADADADAEAEARHGRAAERDGEKLTPILAALAQLRTRTIRARPRSRAASSASAQRRAQTSWARSRRGGEDTREAKAPRAEGHRAGRSSS